MAILETILFNGEHVIGIRVHLYASVRRHLLSLSDISRVMFCRSYFEVDSVLS